MDSMRLLISAFADFGDQLGTIDGSVYRVTETWNESVNADEFWDYRSNIDLSPETSASFSLPEQDTTTYTDFKIDLPVKLAEIWQDTLGGDQNHGILLDFSSTGIIREFSSRQGIFPTRYPRLVYVYHEAGSDSTIRDTVFTTRDASLIDFTGNLDQDRIYIMSGFTARAFFKFDFSDIPKNANISSASFFYSQDAQNSVVNDNRSQNFYMRNVTTEFNKLPSYDIDSTFVFSTRRNIVLNDNDNTGLILDDGIRADAGGYFIQDIINEYVNNGSFLLHYVSEGFDVSIYAINGIDTPSKESRPRLILEYFLNPRGRL
jgi:hypothetical protein